MIQTIWSLFIMGLLLGCGPCLLSCGPLLLSYITATKVSGYSGFVTYIVFSATRLFVYLILGILVGLFGEWILHNFLESFALSLAFLFFGIFLIFLGVMLIIEKSPTCRTPAVGNIACNPIVKRAHVFLLRYLEPKGLKNVIIFGLVVSLAPCLPLMAILGYIALISDTYIKGALYMTSFALGTVVSPLIILSVAAGWVASILKRHERIMKIVKIFCGLIICALGLNLVLAGLK